MRIVSFLLAVLFSFNSYAAGLSAPFTGSRLTGLTRSSTIAEYDSTVDHSGNLIDQSGSNYFGYSQEFDNAAWTKNPGTATVTANSVRAPDGTLTADLFNEGTAGSGDAAQSVQQQPTLATGTYTQSVYIKYKSSGRSWMYMGCAGVANKYAWFNIQTGAVGTVQSLVSSYKIQPVAGGWYRVYVTTTDTAVGSTWVIRAAEADNDTSYTGDGRGAFYIWGAQLAKNDEWRQGPGVYHATTGASTNKPLLDMVPGNAPTEATSYLQTAGGRRLKARHFVNASSQYYEVGHQAAMNIGTADFTISTLFKKNASGTNADLLAHYVNNSFGYYIGYRSDDTVRCTLHKTTGGAANIVVSSGATGVKDSYHYIQAVRRSNILTVWLDGVPGTPTSVVGYGENGSSSLYIGNSPSSAYPDADIIYMRVDAEALSDVQLAKEREQIQGTLFGSGNLNPGSTFSRTTTATQTFSDGTVGYVPAGVPRVSGDGGGVLVEEQRENKILQSQTFGTTWATTELTSITSDGAVAPDGTVTADGLISTAVDTLHRIEQSVTPGAVVTTFSIFAKSGNKNWLYISDSTVASANSYFNIQTCTVGTTGVATIIATAKQFSDSWCRCSIVFTAAAGANVFRVYPAQANGDVDFAGDAATVNTWLWGAQVELGAHPTSYIPTTSASVTRTADSLTIEPWKVTKPAVGTPNFAMYFDNDVYSAGTYTSEIGNYTFTVNGDTKHVESQTLGDYFSFDGTGDSLSIATSAFDPTTDFSIVAIFTPASVTSYHAICHTGNPNTYELYTSGDDIAFSINDGVGATSLNKADSIVIGKTHLVTLTMTKGAGATDNTSNLYVDNLAVATDASQRWPRATTVFTIGDIYGGGEGLNGKLHYLAYVHGRAISQAEHTAMYNAFKQANILPVKIGNSYEAKKLYIEFEAKCPFVSSTDVGSTRRLLEISGNTGTAASGKNRLNLYFSDTGRIGAYFYDNASTEHSAYTGVNPVAMNQWNVFKLYLDFSNFANMMASINGGGSWTYTGNSGTGDFDLTDTQVRFGQLYTGTITGNCSIRKLRIRATP